MKRISHIILLSILFVGLFVYTPISPVQAASGTTITVNSNADTQADDGVCTLREAILAANTDTASGVSGGECAAGTGEDSIVFSLGENALITLTASLPMITSGGLFINGFNNGNTVTVNGAALYNLIDNTAGAELTISNITLEGGVAASGGGVINYGTLTIERSALLNNSAVFGGAIYNAPTGIAVITNVTISGNTASNDGAGIRNDGNISLLNVTIHNNQNAILTNPGGGIANNTGATLDIENSILVNNAPDDCASWGTIGVNSTNNIIKTTDGTGPCSPPSTSNTDPALGALEGNPAAHPITYGSSALDAGSSNCPSTDQRGMKRPLDGNLDTTNTCDIGAFEFAPFLYVNDDASGFGNGENWTDAYSSLQDALYFASAGTNIWVAQGVYYPDEGGYGDIVADDRVSTFNLKTDVAVFGGFAGNETALNQRNVKANPAILSGDIDKDDTNDDGNQIAEIFTHIQNNNAYHVVTANGVNGNTVLDGFIITAGKASGSVPHHVGGGMFIHSGASPTLAYLTFSGNWADNGIGDGRGGGMYTEGNSAPSLSNSYFVGNTAVFGGAMFNDNSDPIVESTTFENNSAFYGGAVEHFNGSEGTFTNVTIYNNEAITNNGGGFYNADSSPILRNVTISHNKAPGTNGGGFHNIDTINANPSNPTLVNSIIAYSVSGGDCINSGGALLALGSDNNLIQDTTNTCDLANNVNGNKIGIDPLLGGLADNGGFAPTLMLQANSPALDAGLNIACSSIDQRGRDRTLTTADPCDMGAYELQKGQITLYSNGTQDGWVLESSETSGKGGTLNKGASTINVGDDAANKQYRSLLSFNTASLPDNAVITKVTLKVKPAGVVGGGNPITTFNGFMVDLKKGAFGTSTLVISDFNTAAGKTLGAFKPSLSGGWYAINLTSGKAQVNLTGTTQIRLRFKIDDNNNFIANYLKLYSGNAGSSSRPQLIVEYYVP